MAGIAGGLPLLSQRGATPHEQTRFSAEDEAVQHPVEIPEDAWKLLQADESVRNSLEGEKLSVEQLPRSWFSAAAVHLHDAATSDLIVEGEGLLRGANVNPFWVFVRTGKGLKLAMMIPAHDLILGSQRYRGYKMIEAASMNCCTVFTWRLRFDGERYVKASQSSQGGH
jgi:hypothetical protein